MSRRIVITGGNRGLGLATAQALARAGGRCSDGPRRREGRGGGRHAARRGPGGGRTRWTSPPMPTSRPCSPQLGVVDVLINNAGVASDKGHGDGTLGIPVQRGLHAFDTNTLGPWRTLRAVLPGMNRRGYGRVVNVSSGMGGLAEMDGGWPAYRVSKAALNAVTASSATRPAAT
ncbi:MAG: SDR family NAD(P)-dependent oxidoreductase [bacterium]